MAEKRWMVAERHKNENNNIFSRIIILCRKQCEQHAMSSKRTLGIHASVERANCTMTYIIFFFNFISYNMLNGDFFRNKIATENHIVSFWHV